MGEAKLVFKCSCWEPGSERLEGIVLSKLSFLLVAKDES
jgi:hypothetical protein